MHSTILTGFARHIPHAEDGLAAFRYPVDDTSSVMIGARNAKDALKEARKHVPDARVELLEVWKSEPADRPPPGPPSPREQRRGGTKAERAQRERNKAQRVRIADGAFVAAKP